MTISNRKYWNDLVAEGRGLSGCAEGRERDFTVPLHAEDRRRHREIAELYHVSPEAIRQREQHAIKTIRNAMNGE